MITENNPPFNGKLYECAPGCDPVTAASYVTAPEALEIFRYLEEERFVRRVKNFKEVVKISAVLPLTSFDSIFSRL